MNDDAAPVEQVVTFECDRARLWGIVSRPAAGRATSDTAVLILVGGPQYRVGSHRQFVLLARALAAAGFAALRFDFSGMGDSEGARRSFEATAPDLRAALDALSRCCPRARRLVVWGLCDAASAALMFATGDPRVAGIVVANPWARSDATLAVTQVKHYYAKRILEADFWLKALRGGLQWRGSAGALFGALRATASHGRRHAVAPGEASFRTKMALGLERFRGRVLLILSGNDLTAKEFIEHAGSDRAWRGLLGSPKLSRVDLAEADHTFSTRAWLDAASAATITWLNLFESSGADAPPRETTPMEYR